MSLSMDRWCHRCWQNLEILWTFLENPKVCGKNEMGVAGVRGHGRVLIIMSESRNWVLGSFALKPWLGSWREEGMCWWMILGVGDGVDWQAASRVWVRRTTTLIVVCTGNCRWFGPPVFAVWVGGRPEKGSGWGTGHYSRVGPFWPPGILVEIRNGRWWEERYGSAFMSSLGERVKNVDPRIFF